MIQRFRKSRGTISCVLAMATGLTLYFMMPFPTDNFFFELMYLWARPVFWGFKCTYILLLYTTPFIGYSILFSGIYVFGLKVQRPDKPERVPTARNSSQPKRVSIRLIRCTSRWRLSSSCRSFSMCSCGLVSSASRIPRKALL